MAQLAYVGSIDAPLPRSASGKSNRLSFWDVLGVVRRVVPFLPFYLSYLVTGTIPLMLFAFGQDGRLRVRIKVRKGNGYFAKTLIVTGNDDAGRFRRALQQG